MKKNCLLLFILMLSSCISSKKQHSPSVLFETLLQSEAFYQSFSGFTLYDPEAEKYLYSLNSDKYFTTASNMKLFTLYTGLKLLPDSVPALYYLERNDSLIFWGTGDPTFLHPLFQNNKVFQFLKDHPKKLVFSPLNYEDMHFGPGWAWDDYVYAYSAEKAPFPIYGNLLEIQLSGNPQLQMPVLNLGFATLNRYDKDYPLAAIHREIGSNQFSYFSGADTVSRKISYPFKYSPDLLTGLLSDTLHRKVGLQNIAISPESMTLYGCRADSLYKQMLHESDNFVAEQLLLLSSGMINKRLNSKEAIEYMNTNYLGYLSDSIRWVDGSGLSRYNLATPRTIIELLEILYKEVETERLFTLFPSGGRHGNIKGYFKSEKPFIYAKTGSFSNNFNISGFLITSSGKTLIFSFMNNNFMVPMVQVRKEIERILYQAHLEF